MKTIISIITGVSIGLGIMLPMEQGSGVYLACGIMGFLIITVWDYP